MTGTDPTNGNPSLSRVAPEEKARRAGSFGEVASHYERYRPGPPVSAVEWILPERAGRVVDLGAGTGALTRLLTDRAGEVIAVEPDDRMRAILAAAVPRADAVTGRGESIPLPDGSVDAVLASSSWHWMDPIPTLTEVGRVLVPGGILAALWSGPDPEGPFLTRARDLLAGRSPRDSDRGGAPGGELASLIAGDVLGATFELEIPPGVPFGQPEHAAFTWDVALDADELIGLLGTLSWIITMGEDQRERVIAEARRLLRELLGIEGDVTVDVAFRCDAWRSRRS